VRGTPGGPSGSMRSRHSRTPGGSVESSFYMAEPYRGWFTGVTASSAHQKTPPPQDPTVGSRVPPRERCRTPSSSNACTCWMGWVGALRRRLDDHSPPPKIAACSFSVTYRGTSFLRRRPPPRPYLRPTPRVLVGHRAMVESQGDQREVGVVSYGRGDPVQGFQAHGK